MRWVGPALCLVGCTRPAENRAQKTINALLPEAIGQARRYRTKVDGDSLGALMRGRIRRVTIEGDDVALEPDLLLETLWVEANEIDVDLRARTIQRVGAARFSARLSQAAVERFVRARRSGLGTVQITLRDEGMLLSARPEVLGYPTVTVTVIGALSPRDGGTQLDFTPDRGRLARLPIPGPVVDFVARQLNPALDLRGLRLPIRVDRVRPVDGALVLSGTIPPDSLEGLGSR